MNAEYDFSEAEKTPYARRLSRRRRTALEGPTVSAPMAPFADDLRQRIEDVMRRRGVVRAGVFGSFAHGDAAPRSDVDFLVEFEEGRTLLDLSGLRLDLCETLTRDVDVATPNSLHPKMRDRILSELIRIL